VIDDGPIRGGRVIGDPVSGLTPRATNDGPIRGEVLHCENQDTNTKRLGNNVLSEAVVIEAARRKPSGLPRATLNATSRGRFKHTKAEW